MYDLRLSLKIMFLQYWLTVSHRFCKHHANFFFFFFRLTLFHHHRCPYNWFFFMKTRCTVLSTRFQVGSFLTELLGLDTAMPRLHIKDGPICRDPTAHLDKLTDNLRSHKIVQIEFPIEPRPASNATQSRVPNLDRYCTCILVRIHYDYPVLCCCRARYRRRRFSR